MKAMKEQTKDVQNEFNMRLTQVLVVSYLSLYELDSHPGAIRCLTFLLDVFLWILDYNSVQGAGPKH